MKHIRHPTHKQTNDAVFLMGRDLRTPDTVASQNG